MTLAAGAGADENGPSLNGAPMAAPSKAIEIGLAPRSTRGFGMIAPRRSLEDVTGAGLAFGLSVDWRMSPRWSVGAAGEYQEFRQEQNSSVRGVATSLGATYHFLPERVGDPWLRLGTGYRSLWENDPVGSSVSSVQRRAFELATLTLGYDVRLTEDVAIAPTAGATFDLFVWQAPPTSGQAAPASPGVATFVYAGFQGRFEIGGTRH